MTTMTTSHWRWMAIVGLAGIGAGAAGTYLITRRAPDSPSTSSAAAPMAAATESGPAVIQVSADAATRAGIQIGKVATSTLATDLTVPGHVEANGYTQVAVRATANGRITSFTAELGALVRRGQVLGQMFAPEVADQQRQYLSMRAELAAAHAKLVRTEELVKLGSVSQQELEAVRAEHTTHATDVEGARARLMLLGVSTDRLDKLATASDIDANTSILSPANGVIIRRAANPGLNVQVGEELVTVADLSRVWVVADVFERDLGRVKVGSHAIVRSPADPAATWPSAISYLDPQVVPETRTIRLRADVQNPGERLKIGQYVDVTVSGVKATSLQVPREAVQTIANRHFVYVPDPTRNDRFIEREVRIGATTPSAIEILSGVSDGESVVTAGSFFLRAERDRLGLPMPPPLPPAMAAPPVATYDIAITPTGFEPARITIDRNVPAELRFTRKTDQTCATAVSVPSLNIKRDLPLNVTVSVPIPPRATGELAFVCGMNMLKGTVVVR
jgi:RND family efflux transporter MFP subunit